MAFPWLWEGRNHRKVLDGSCLLRSYQPVALRTKVRGFFEFWMGEWSEMPAEWRTLHPSPALASETHEMSMRADSALTDI